MSKRFYKTVADVEEDVPCNGCTRCCQGDAVRIFDHEDSSQWKTEPHPYYPGKRMLGHKRDKSCVYLGKKGCTIYDNRPEQCQTMDCRNVARNMTYTQARKFPRMLPIWRKGKELLRA